MSKTSKTLLALLAGGIAGAVAGLLMAPKRGEETIEDLKDTFNKTKNDVNNRANRLKDDVKDQYEKAVHFIETKRNSWGKELEKENVKSKASRSNGEPRKTTGSVSGQQ